MPERVANWARMAGVVLAGLVMLGGASIAVAADRYWPPIVDPATAQHTPGRWVWADLVTLPTVGYGDVLPVSNAARTLAVIEATVGQFYIAAIVAVFVGMYASERRRSA